MKRRFDIRQYPFLLAAAALAGDSYNPFLYFRF